MDRTRENTISFIIKAVIGVVFVVLFVLLLSQYITMAGLEDKKNKLDTELENVTSQYNELQNEYESIRENYDEYVEDYTRDNYNYGYDDDIIINKS